MSEQRLRIDAESVVPGFRGKGTLAALGELVRTVPSYALDLSPEPAANARAIDRLVGELG